MKEKDRVKLTWDPHGPTGTVMRVGVEVSEVVFDDGKRVRMVPNEQLVPVDGPSPAPVRRHVRYRRKRYP